jgi:hypothetical protein
MSESVVRPVSASHPQPSATKTRIHFAADTADLHKRFEGRHKLTPFQLQLSAVNRATGPSSTLVTRA